MKTLYVKCDVHCPFSATIEIVQRLLQSGAYQSVGPLSIFRTPVQYELAQVDDHTDQTRIHDALLLSWKAHMSIPTPTLQGIITVRPHGPATEMRMEGTYLPPLGLIGEIFDRVIGRHIARLTISRFLAELGDLVEAEWQKERVN